MTLHKLFSEIETPKKSGYFFPAEFAPHVATWLSWPHKEASWPGKIHAIYPAYAQFVKALAESELVRINVNNSAMKQQATGVFNGCWCKYEAG